MGVPHGKKIFMSERRYAQRGNTFLAHAGQGTSAPREKKNHAGESLRTTTLGAHTG